MRVLHVYKNYFPDSQGGLEETIRQICRSCSHFGVRNNVFTLTPNSRARILPRKEARVYRSSRSLQIASCDISFSALPQFQELLQRTDLVHYHFPWPMADLLHLLGRPRIPSLVTYHSDIVRQKKLLMLYRPLKKLFLNRVQSIVATSPNYFATSDVLSRYSEKVDVIPIGVDEASYPETDPNLVRSLRETVGEGFFLFIGVMRYYKGLHILLDAIQGTNLQVVIAGAGPAEEELKAHAANLGLNNVLFMGHVSDAEKMALYKLARAVVFPSCLRSEAFGVTLVEGAMQGLPLISTEIGTGTSYVNKDGESGIVVPPADPKRFREAMLKLANDPELARELGKGARQRYEANFTGELMGRRYVELYKRLLGGNGGRQTTEEGKEESAHETHETTRKN